MLTSVGRQICTSNPPNPAQHLDSYGIPATDNTDRFGYTGQIWFKELGLFYYKARMYHPKLGRFMQNDPIGYSDSMNLYGYTGNDPLNMIDPSGMNKVCTGDTNKPNGESDQGSCSDDGNKPDPEDEIVIIGHKTGLYRLKGPEQFISVHDDGLAVFDADSAEECTTPKGTFEAYHTSAAHFDGGDPGHTHPSGSSDPMENIEPTLGPDDGKAANLTGRAYMISPKGIVRINRSGTGAYSATLIQGGFGESDAKVINKLTQFNQNAGSQVQGWGNQNCGTIRPM